MFKYFLISVIFHSVIFGGFVFFKSKESNSSNYKEEVQVLQNKNNQYNLTLKLNWVFLSFGTLRSICTTISNSLSLL